MKLLTLSLLLLSSLAPAGEPTDIVELAREGEDIQPAIERYAKELATEPATAKIAELALIYHARAGYVATFSEDQAEALLTIACLLQRRSGPVPALADAEADLDRILNRFKATGIALIRPGEGWSYHDDAPFADDSWAGSDFDDTFWSVGDAPLGHGPGGITTETKTAPALYLRRYFDIDAPGLIVTLRTTAFGTAAIDELFINGKARALGEITPADLVEGSNTLAIRAVPAKEGKGLNFDFELTANLPSAAHHLDTVTDAELGLAIGKAWAALPAAFRSSLLAPAAKDAESE